MCGGASEGGGGAPGGFAAAGAKSIRDKTALSNPEMASGPDREQAARAKSLGTPGAAPNTPTVGSIGEFVAAPVRAASLIGFTNLAVTVIDEIMNPGQSSITKAPNAIGNAVRDFVNDPSSAVSSSSPPAGGNSGSVPSTVQEGGGQTVSTRASATVAAPRDDNRRAAAALTGSPASVTSSRAVPSVNRGSTILTSSIGVLGDARIRKQKLGA